MAQNLYCTLRLAGSDRQRQDEPAFREGTRPVDGALQVRRGAQPEGAHPGEREREAQVGSFLIIKVLILKAGMIH